MLCLVTKSELRVERELTEEEAVAVRDPLYDSASAELALGVLREARENGLWLRCDCRIDSDDDPLVAPCRLPMGAGYTWRVLQGGNRPQHHADCVFYRESREQRAEKNWQRAARVPPEGYFAALRARKDGNSAELHTPRGRRGSDRPPPCAGGEQRQGAGAAANAGIAGAPVPVGGDGRPHADPGE